MSKFLCGRMQFATGIFGCLVTDARKSAQRLKLSRPSLLATLFPVLRARKPEPWKGCRGTDLPGAEQEKPSEACESRAEVGSLTVVSAVAPLNTGPTLGSEKKFLTAEPSLHPLKSQILIVYLCVLVSRCVVTS